MHSSFSGSSGENTKFFYSGVADFDNSFELFGIGMGSRSFC